MTNAVLIASMGRPDGDVRGPHNLALEMAEKNAAMELEATTPSIVLGQSLVQVLSMVAESRWTR